MSGWQTQGTLIIVDVFVAVRIGGWEHPMKPRGKLRMVPSKDGNGSHVHMNLSGAPFEWTIDGITGEAWATIHRCIDGLEIFRMLAGRVQPGDRIILGPTGRLSMAG